MKLADHLQACLWYWARVAVTQGVVIAMHDRCDKHGNKCAHGVGVLNLTMNLFWTAIGKNLLWRCL